MTATKTPRVTPFSVGRRWRVTRVERPSFDFVVVGPGDRPNTKRCRLDVDFEWFRRCGYGEPSEQQLRMAGHHIEQDYSHKHLKKCAKLVEL